MDCGIKFAMKRDSYDDEAAFSLARPSRKEYLEILPEPSTKCGEVFLGYGGVFTLVCAICSCPFTNFESFGEHIHDAHLNPNSSIDTSRIEGLRVDIHNDPLGSSPNAGNQIGPKQAETSPQLVQMKIEVMRMSPENELEQVHHDEDSRNDTIVSINSTESTYQNSRFTCDLCYCTYKHQRHYLAHVSTHGVLTKSMRNKSALQARENAANNSRTTSPTSDTMLSFADDSTQHSLNSESGIENITKEDTYLCIICDRKYKHERSLLFHIRTNHGKKEMQKISQPGPDLASRLDALSEDEYRKSSLECDQEYRCDICGRIYRRIKSLRVHIKHDHYENAPHISVDETVCKYCDKEFSSNDLLKTHIHNDHPSDKKFVCPHCPKTFKSRFTRQGHINTHTGERRYKCSHCSQAFCSPWNLSVHSRMHRQIERHCCSFCDKTFLFKSERRRHEMTHTGEKPHQCEECGKRYGTSGKLTEHRRRHKNIKNYKCDVCSKTFYSLALLKNHKMVHSSERPFSCNICGQAFSRKRALTVHEQLHSDVKKYICNTCGKAFAQYAGLYSHKKSHEEVK